MQKAKNYELIFNKKIKESEDTYSFYFDRNDLNFNFSVGQYVKLFLDIKNPDSRGSSRNLTISSSPTDKENLVFTTKIIKSSFKKSLIDLSKGDKVKAFGPVGYFDFDEKNNKKIVLIAGGIGITPFYSLINYIIAKELKIVVSLIVSFELRKNVIFFDELKKIQNENNRIKIIYTLTKEKNSFVDFEKGRISSELINKYVKYPEKSKFFIVGSAEMVEDLFIIIKKMNIKDSNIFKEDFTGY